MKGKNDGRECLFDDFRQDDRAAEDIVHNHRRGTRKDHRRPEKKAATEYPDDYAVAQTQKVYHAVVEGDLHFDGTDYIDPPQPTAEELQAAALAELDSEYQSRFNELDEQIVKAAALKNTELQDSLINERTALAAEYAEKRGNL